MLSHFTKTRMLVCDMAGTTVNEGGVVYRTLYETLRMFSVPITRDDVDHWYGHSKHEVLGHFIREKKKSEDAKRVFDKQLLWNYEHGSISLIDPRLPDHFNRLRDRGMVIALNTGYSKEVQDVIVDRLRMDAFIDTRISSSEVPRGRPHPDMMIELSLRTMIPPINTVKVGDTQADVDEAINIGALPFGVLTGAECNFLRCPIVLDSVMEL